MSLYPIFVKGKHDFWFAQSKELVSLFSLFKHDNSTHGIGKKPLAVIAAETQEKLHREYIDTFTSPNNKTRIIYGTSGVVD